MADTSERGGADDPYLLNRFARAQEDDYDHALAGDGKTMEVDGPAGRSYLSHSGGCLIVSRGVPWETDERYQSREPSPVAQADTRGNLRGPIRVP